MKSWRIKNDGSRPWPEGTMLTHVAGVRFGTSGPIKVELAEVDQEVDLWTGELKAPETPGHYIGYWCLVDDIGRVFGHSIWIDVTIAEPSPNASDNGSLSNSSVIMPQASSLAGTAVTAHSDAVSESSISIISTPAMTEGDEDWEDAGEDAVPVRALRTTNEAGAEYVMLYDDASSDGGL